MAPAISVCICTFKRPSALLTLLESLAKQSIQTDEFETVVIDNDETGSAASVIENFKRSHPELTIIYDIEPRRGISYARNKTVLLSQGKLLAFIDDDEVAHTDWLSNLVDQITLDQSDAVFGPVLPKYPENTPGWIIDSEFFERPRFLSGTRLRWNDTRTGNALVKAEWAKRRHPTPFKYELALTGGEDTDFFRWISCQKGFFTWCDTAEVTEIVASNRLHLAFMLKRSFRQSVTYWLHEYSKICLIYRFFIASIGVLSGLMFLTFGLFSLPLGIATQVKMIINAFKAFGRVGALFPRLITKTSY